MNAGAAGAALGGTALVLAVVTAFVTVWATAALVARIGPVDPVKARSSHARPTPTSAGLGIVAGFSLGLALWGALWGALGGVPGGVPAGAAGPLAWLLGAAAALGLFGAADDLLDLDARTKLAVQLLCAGAILWGTASVGALPLAPGFVLALHPGLGAAGGLLFLIVLMNGFNFMDGANGLAPGAAVVSALGLAAAGLLFGAPEVAAAALVLAGGVGGLLVLNARGRVFQGDAGAIFTAAVLGGLGLRLAETGATTPYLVVFTVLPLLADVLLTLLARARRGAPFFEAHREHLYQLWLQAGGRAHLALAWRVCALCAATTAVGLAFELYARDWAFAGLMASAGLLALGWTRARARLSAAGPPRSAADAPTAARPADAAGRGRGPSRRR